MIQDYSFRKIHEGLVVKIGNRSMFFKDITEEQMIEAVNRYVNGALIQEAYNFLDADQREFLMTGLFPGDWENIF